MRGLVEHLSGPQEALDSMLNTTENQVLWGTAEILAFRKRQEVQEFEVIPGCIGSLRPAYETLLFPLRRPLKKVLPNIKQT